MGLDGIAEDAERERQCSVTSDQWRVKAAGQGSMEEGKAGKREDEKGGRGEERVVDCLNHRLHGLRRLHGLKLRDWIGRDVERDLYGKRAGEGTGSLSQSLSAPLIPYGFVRSRN